MPDYSASESAVVRQITVTFSPHLLREVSVPSWVKELPDGYNEIIPISKDGKPPQYWDISRIGPQVEIELRGFTCPIGNLSPEEMAEHPMLDNKRNGRLNVFWDGKPSSPLSTFLVFNQRAYDNKHIPERGKEMWAVERILSDISKVPAGERWQVQEAEQFLCGEFLAALRKGESRSFAKRLDAKRALIAKINEDIRKTLGLDGPKNEEGTNWKRDEKIIAHTLAGIVSTMAEKRRFKPMTTALLKTNLRAKYPGYRGKDDALAALGLTWIW